MICKRKRGITNMKKYLIIINIVLQFFVCLVINSINFTYDYFGDIKFEIVIFQIFTPLQGTSPEILKLFFINVILKTILTIIVINLTLFLFFLFIGKTLLDNVVPLKYINMLKKIIAFGITYIKYFFAVFQFRDFGVFDYIHGLFTQTRIYEDE